MELSMGYIYCLMPLDKNIHWIKDKVQMYN